jgi:hypothetical protein
VGWRYHFATHRHRFRGFGSRSRRWRVRRARGFETAVGEGISHQKDGALEVGGARERKGPRFANLRARDGDEYQSHHREHQPSAQNNGSRHSRSPSRTFQSVPSLTEVAVPPEILDNSPLSLDLPVGHFFSELPKLVLTEMSAHPPDPASNVITDAFSSPSVGFVSRTLVTLSLSFQNTVR